MSPPLRDDITSSIRASWRIVLRDPQAMHGFNLTVEGFWRSFLAAGIAAPFFAISSAQLYLAMPEATRTGIAAYAGVKLLLYIAFVASFPLAMIPISRLLRVSDAYVPLIVATNWASVLIVAAALPVQLLGAAAGPESETARLAAMIFLAGLLYYSYLVVRAALKCDIGMALGLVVLQFVLTELLFQIAERLLAVPSPA